MHTYIFSICMIDKNTTIFNSLHIWIIHSSVCHLINLVWLALILPIQVIPISWCIPVFIIISFIKSTIGTYFGTYASGDTLCMCVMHNMMHSLYCSIQTLFFFTGWAVLHEIKYLMFVSINLVIVVLKSTLNEKRYSVWKVFFLNYYFRIAKLKYLVIREQFYGELPSKPKE